MNVIDTNHNVSGKIAQLKALGIDTVFRYITSNTANEKCVKQAEARALGAAGIKLGLVYETYGGVDNFEHGDINSFTGRNHAQLVKSWLPQIGAPAIGKTANSPIVYFAIDTDATNDQINKLVLPYLNSARIWADGAFGIGVYGCGAACKAALDSGAAMSAWLSNAMGWNGSKAFRDSTRWDILQSLPRMIAGLDTDPDQLSVQHDLNPHRLNDVAFIPFASAAPVIETTSTSEYVAKGDWQRDIMATVFGDNILGAYGRIAKGAVGVALPGGFKAPFPRVQVQLARTGASLAGSVLEKGPWYDGTHAKPYDPYWEHDARPRAESDHHTNGAGIDLTPALAKALGHNGKEKVHWRFVE